MIFPRVRSFYSAACAGCVGKETSTRRYFIGEARKNSRLRMANVGAYEKRGTRRVPRLECLHDVVASMRRALCKFSARICDCAAELDLQREPRLRLDKRGISGLLGDSFVKFPIAHGICFHLPAQSGDHGFTEYIFKPPDVAVAHLRDGELDRETFKPLV